jgi:hypothetical protein
LATLAAHAVAVNERTRCAPEKNRAALYRQRQTQQDSLSLTLRETFDRLSRA